MTCTIDWSLSPDEYAGLYGMTTRPNLLQDIIYGKAVCAGTGKSLRHGLIYSDGQKAGVVQIVTSTRFAGKIQTMALDRGPLWLDGFGKESHRAAFFGELARHYPREFLRILRIIPEWEDMPAIRTSLSHAGFRRINRPGYSTAWLDLRPDPKKIRRNMRPNWRGALRKAEKSDIETVWNFDAAQIDTLLSLYTQDKAQRRYKGPSPKFLYMLASAYSKSNNLMIGWALSRGRICSAMMALCHGRAATWQTGWNDDTGRSVCAGNLLLWQAAIHLKERGIHDVDLGGYDQTHSPGLQRFKQGTGAQHLTLAGHYI
jgi:hypothetical protein